MHMKRRPLPYYESSLHSRPLAVILIALVVTLGTIPALFATSTLPIFGTDGVTPITLPQQPVGISLSRTTFGPDQTAVVTFTFPAIPDGFTLADVSAPNGTLSGLAATADPDVYTATYTPNPGTIDSSNAITMGPIPSHTNFAPSGLDGGVANLAFDGTNMWEANYQANSVTKIPLDGSPVTRYSISDEPISIAFDGTNMWTANPYLSTISKITPDGTITTYPTPSYPYNLAFDGSRMWVTDNGGTLAKVALTAPSSSENYSIDTVVGVGSVTSAVITLDTYAVGTGQTATVTFTFPIAPASFSLADVTADNGTLSGLTATSDPKVYTATFTPNPGVTADTNDISIPESISAETFSGTGSQPYAITYDGNDIWTANQGDNTVTKFGLDGSVIGTYTVGNLPSALASDGINMWVTNQSDSTVTKIAPDGTKTDYGGIGANPDGIAFDGTNMWTANVLGNSVSKIAPSGTVTTFTGISEPRAIAFDGTNMWTANEGDDSISKITPSGVVATYPGLGANPHSIAFDGTNMWTANVAGDSLSKVAPDGTITNYSDGGHANSLVFDGTDLWTSNPGVNSVSKIGLDGTITTYAGVGNAPTGIAFDGTDLWLADYSGDSVTKISPILGAASPNYQVDTVTDDTSGGGTGGSGGSGGGTSGGGTSGGGSGGSGGAGGHHGIALFPPSLMETQAVITPTTNSTPSYTFYSTESGTVTYGGGCSSSTTFVGRGDTTITFSSLANGLYANCTIQETDGAGRISNILHVSSFTVNNPSAVPPVQPSLPWIPQPVIPRPQAPVTPKIAPALTLPVPTPVPALSSSSATMPSESVPVAAPASTPSVTPSAPQAQVNPVPAASAIPAVVVPNPCPFGFSSNTFGMIWGEISWRYCVTEPSIAAAFAHFGYAYAAHDGALIAKVVSFIAILGAGFMIFTSGLFLDPLSAADAALIPVRVWELLLESLNMRKRKTAWGTVYDSVTKAPLDPVRIELRTQDGSKVVASTVTSIDGKFGFVGIAPGNYVIAVKKEGYSFPSQKLSGMPHDEVYAAMYHGDAITVSTPGGIVSLNIPLDPLNMDWKSFVASKSGLVKAYALGDKLISISASLFLFVGIVSSAASLVMSPDAYGLVAFAAALGIALVRPKTLFADRFGYVKDAETGEPLSFGIVRIASENGQPLVDVVLSATGRYSYPLPKGRYLITIDKKLPDGSYRTIAKELPAETHGGYLSKSFSVHTNNFSLLSSMFPKNLT